MEKQEPEGSRPNDAPWVQAELDAGRDVNITGKRLVSRNTIDFRKGAGRIVGVGLIESIASPLLWAAPDYEHPEHLAEIPIKHVDAIV